MLLELAAASIVFQQFADALAEISIIAEYQSETTSQFEMEYLQAIECLMASEYSRPYMEELYAMAVTLDDPFIVPGDSGRTCHDYYISYDTANPYISHIRITGVRWYTCATGV